MGYKRDANNVKDNAVVPAKNLAGVYRRRIQGLGNVSGLYADVKRNDGLCCVPDPSVCYV